MRMPLRMFLRDLRKFLPVVVVGAVAAGLGIALAELTGTDDSPPIAPDPTSATMMSPTQPRTGSATTSVQILSAVLYPARTARGRARQRARVVGGVRVTNHGTDSVRAQAPVLIVGRERIRADPRAVDAAGALLEPLAPEETATGELSFETAGSVTRRLMRTRHARLSIAQRTVNVTIRISSTPAPAG